MNHRTNIDAATPVEAVTIHPAAADGTVLLRELERLSHPAYFRPLIGAFPFPVARVSGPDEIIATARDGLPGGPARPEAIAVRLRRRGVPLTIGAPDRVPTAAALLRSSHARGESSVDVIRADPSLLTELQIGSWFHTSARMRGLRLVLLRVQLPTSALRYSSLLALGCDLAFWAGVRSAASAHEWRRLTRSSYVCLYYHRIAGEMKPGQERLDLSPKTFRRQMRLLRLFRFRPLSPDELLRFHADPSVTLPRRRYVVTADDAFADAAAALARHLSHRPHLYVSTAVVGGSADWADGERLAGWDQLRSLHDRGAIVGSHGRTHVVLTDLADGVLDEELTGSLRELGARLGHPAPFLAYPHGRHDATVRAAAQRAGYRLAYTTRPGRNGAGTDPYCLRRLGIKEWDVAPSFVWKLLSGEHLPRGWERLWLRKRSSAVAGDGG
jgi:peptidoglycan/xylan/chitin deacetylase (PgdA/CDA1 family)